MGRGGEQREWLGAMRPCPQTVLAFARQENGRPRLQPLLRDFHMVGSGYDDADPWQDMLIPKTSERKKPVGPGSKLTHRYYLQDMAFACILAIPQEFEDELSAGLRSPAWPIYLGRKCCVPAALVFRGFYGTPEEAEDQAREIGAGSGRLATLKVVEGEDPGGTALTLHDVPLSFGLHKKYADRVVTVFDLAE